MTKHIKAEWKRVAIAKRDGGSVYGELLDETTRGVYVNAEFAAFPDMRKELFIPWLNISAIEEAKE